jgi:hypothetical protein
MSRIVTTAGRFVERSAALIATPWTVTIGIIFLLNWAFDLVPETDEPAGTAAQQQGRAGARIDHAAVNQTPLAHSVSSLTHTGHRNYGAPAAATEEPGQGPIVGHSQRVPAHVVHHSSAPQFRQRRRPSALAISAALHWGVPR